MAPVLLTVYNRLDHLRQCVDALLRCEGVDKTTLYICSDAPKTEADRKKVNEVRTFIQTLSGFEKIVPVFHSENKGLIGCYEDLAARVLETHDYFIFLEDDIVVAPDFLTYMNEALVYYASDKRVFSVSAFSFALFYSVHPNQQHQVYFTHRFYPWGFGMWKDRYRSMPHYSLQDVSESLSNPEFVERLQASGQDLLPAFQSLVAQKKMLVLDYLNTYHMVNHQQVTVVPYQSKSFNIGHDGSGDRTVKAQRYLNVDLRFLNTKNDVHWTRDMDAHIDNQFNQMHFTNRLNSIKLFLNRLGLLGLAMKIINAYRGKAK